MVDAQSGESATTNPVTPGRGVLCLLEFPDESIVEYCTNSRQHNGKLNTSVYIHSVGCTLAVMVNIHVHKMGDMGNHDIHVSVIIKFRKILSHKVGNVVTVVVGVFQSTKINF